MTYALIFIGVLLLTCAVPVGFTARAGRRVEAALPPPGRFVKIGGARIHHLERGGGPTLLKLHGLGGSVRTFTHSLVERLASEYRVIMMDRPGSGYSTRARGPARV